MCSCPSWYDQNSTIHSCQFWSVVVLAHNHARVLNQLYYRMLSLAAVMWRSSLLWPWQTNSPPFSWYCSALIQWSNPISFLLLLGFRVNENLDLLDLLISGLIFRFRRLPRETEQWPSEQLLFLKWSLMNQKFSWNKFNRCIDSVYQYRCSGENPTNVFHEMMRKLINIIKHLLFHLSTQTDIKTSQSAFWNHKCFRTSIFKLIETLDISNERPSNKGIRPYGRSFLTCSSLKFELLKSIERNNLRPYSRMSV